MFTIAQKKKLIDKLMRPVRLKELRDSAQELMKATRYQHADSFMRAIEDEKIIQLHTLKAKNGKGVHLYSSVPLSEINSYELATAIQPNGYFCNLSAIYHHALTNQVPNTVYWCEETATPRQGRTTQQLTDARIRSAFVRPRRHTSFVIDHGKHDIVVIERTRETDHGVIGVRRQSSPCPAGSRVATLERALIDAVVSPHYNGGITSLCEYFRAAGKQLNMKRLLEIYRKLEFVYPYAQSIGFFMEHSGMAHQAKQLRRAYPPRQRFYVDHGAKTSWIYDERWMIFYPRGLVDDD